MKAATQIPDFLDFSEDPSLSREVQIKGPDGKTYLLRSGTGKVATEYRNASQACFKYGANGRLTQIVNLASVEVQLVAGCLFETDADGNVLKRGDKEVNIPAQRIDNWPAPVKKRLFELARALTGLDEGEDPLKKALEGALLRDDSPVSLADFTTWVQTLPDDVEVLSPLRALFRESPSKNAQGSTTVGSESAE